MQNKTIIIGISGASGSGKSLLANTIVSELGSNKVGVISEDSYYKDLSHLSIIERAQINFDHPESLDHNLLTEHLRKLHHGESVDIPIYDYNSHTRTKNIRNIGNFKIIVLEGILIFVDNNLRNLMNIRVFMDTPSDICLLRRLKRDIKERGRDLDSVLWQYENTVRPMYLQFVEPSKRYADISVPRGGENRIAIDMIKAKMREMLNE